MRKIMKKILVPLGVAAMLAVLPVHAAPVEDVVAACDRMDDAKPGSCRYTVTKDGLGGCTRNGCFFCPADGSRQCHSMRTSGKSTQLQIGAVKLACDRVADGWCKQARMPAPRGK